MRREKEDKRGYERKRKGMRVEKQAGKRGRVGKRKDRGKGMKI